MVKAFDRFGTSAEVLRAAVLSALGYIAIMAAGMFVTGQVIGLGYFDPQFVFALFVVEVVLSLFALAVARRLFGHWHCGFGPVRWRGLAGLLPYLVLMAAFAIAVVTTRTPKPSLLAFTVVVTTMLIGFSEELMFRGIVLKAAVGPLGPARAILLSAMLFALLHAANLLALLPLLAVVLQMSFVFILGIAMGCIALRANSLVPLMAYHTLWNIVQFLGRLWHVDFGRLIVLTLFVNIATAAVLWLAMLRRNKSSPIAPQAPPIPG